ncbi:MAG TPA: alpha-amylase family glycosyl hydrolase [Pyrinomonadaceae bacterium]|nr:alpha-amylase family glycosyl hydrolase [Pyrinomonadaceae bacterium]
MARRYRRYLRRRQVTVRSREHREIGVEPLPRAFASSLVVFFIFAISHTVFGQAPSVGKIDPPSWWANHSVNPIRLLIHGRNLSGARIQSPSPSLRLTNLRQDSNYIFADLHISATTKPGKYTLLVGKADVSFTIEEPLANNNREGVNADDVIYLIMIDRFADGDPTNNNPPDAPAEANDRRNPRAFHGGDLRGIINQLPYLKELGVTALWLTPWHDNWNGVNRCDKPWCPNTYYHGYHAIDYYAVEDRFGDLATLRELVTKAHALGLKVIQDQVANHVGSQHPWVKDPPLQNWFHGTLANHQLNTFRNSALLSPHSQERDLRQVLDGWFSDDLPDMNQDEPEVARYEIQNALWWVGVSGIDGIRQDTIQYMPRAFIRDLSDALHRQYPKLWMVGEVFERDAAHTAFFIGGRKGWDGIDTRLDSVFDFALWSTSLGVFTNKLPVRALREQLKYDALYPDPLKLTVLANNHDTPRFLSLDGADLNGAMLHTAFVLSVRGIPQLYYGEEIAMEGKDDPDNRRDFPVSAFTASGRDPKQQRMFEWTQQWIRLRREHSAIRRGRLIDLHYDDNVYVFARQDSTETVIIAINRQDKEQEVTIPFKSIVPLIGKIRVNSSSTITLPANSVVALKAS